MRPYRRSSGRACQIKRSNIAETGSAERRCPSAGIDLPALMMADREKIEPMQKRQLIATAQSLLHDIQDALECELKGSDK